MHQKERKDGGWGGREKHKDLGELKTLGAALLEAEVFSFI